MQPGTSPVGWGLVRQEMRTEFRNKGKDSELTDSVRQIVVSSGSLVMSARNLLKLKYIPCFHK
jgi:hypothetical protein